MDSIPLENRSKWGFLVKIDGDVEKLKELYPILNDRAIHIELEKKPSFRAERNVQAGARLGPGTLGLFCTNETGSHFAVTASHVVEHWQSYSVDESGLDGYFY